jgi:Arc/MetJ-type ribon-helix-helix transcriptional regulator
VGNSLSEYTTIKLPNNVVASVDKLVGKHGFDSRADVVKDALRDFFEKYPETRILPN